MSEKIKPNSVLPEGATMLSRPTVKNIDGWVEMKYDAKLVYRGVTWYRVYKGFSERGDREDWVASGAGVSIAVHDYHWNGDSFGIDYGSMSAAMDGELESGLQRANSYLAEAETKVASLKSGIAMLEKALAVTDSES